MSLINEALKKARVDAATEHSGPRMDLNAVVTADTQRGGMKVTSLLLATVVALAVGVIGILVIGGSATPRTAGADGADGVGNGNIAGVEPRDVKVNTNENVGESGLTIAQADVGKDAAAARSDEPVIEPTVDPLHKPATAPSKTVEPATTAAGDGPQSATKVGNETDATTEDKVTGPATTELANSHASGQANGQAAADQTQQTAELIAAVVAALEAKHAKEAAAKEDAASNDKADTKPAEPTVSKEPVKPSEPVVAAPRFPTFVGEVNDERFPYLKLSGMSRSNDQQCALINKQILLLGDTIDNVTVERIERKRVRLKYNGQVFFLELP